MCMYICMSVSLRANICVMCPFRPMYVYSYNDTGHYAGVQPVAKLMRENLEKLFNVCMCCILDLCSVCVNVSVV